MPDLSTILSRVGFHAVYEKSVKEAIDLACEHGFSSVQIECSMPQFFPEKYSVKAREKIRHYAKIKSITLKVHAPGEDFSLQTLHNSVQRAIVERLKEVVDFSSDIGEKLVTIHPGTLPAFTIPGRGQIPIDVQYPRLHFQSLRVALKELADYSEGRTILCVENSPFTNVIKRVLSETLNGGRIYLAWDLAKMYRRDGKVITDVEGFFLRHLAKVRECHLHDLTEETGHQIIGEGFVDFKRYLSLLCDHDVEYTIEVRPVQNAVKSLRTLREILEQSA